MTFMVEKDDERFFFDNIFEAREQRRDRLRKRATVKQVNFDILKRSK